MRGDEPVSGFRLRDVEQRDADGLTATHTHAQVIGQREGRGVRERRANGVDDGRRSGPEVPVRTNTSYCVVYTPRVMSNDPGSK